MRCTCVYPPVGFEVGALGVDLVASVVVTHVHSPPLHVRGVRVRREVYVHARAEREIQRERERKTYGEWEQGERGKRKEERK